MEFELEQFVKYYSNVSLCVQGVYHYTIEPGSSGRQKTAAYRGFIFPISGRAQYAFDGTVYTTDPQKIIHGGPDMVLDKLVLGNAKWEYISVFYEMKGSKPEGMFMPDMHFELTIGHSPRLTELLWRLRRTFTEPGVIPAYQSEVLFRCILEEIFISAANRTSDSAHQLFHRVSTYIHDYYMEGITARGLAEQNGVTVNRLFYVFRKYAGMGPGDYLLQYRLNRAKELLVTSDALVSDIAHSVGYEDALYFSRVFKKRFGITPSGLRDKFRNNPYPS